jgi:2-polyprenyl-3-methyl-5-hydroxy-6-metoxy-1,4-benzoquinol methylase
MKTGTNPIGWDPTTHYKDVAVAENYDRVRFNSIPGRVFEQLERTNILRAFRSVPKGSTILDLPCGTGRLAHTLLDAGYKVMGVDISAAMLEVSRRRLARFGDRFSSRVEDVYELAANQAKCYDSALCARVLMHFPLEAQIKFLGAVAHLTQGPVVFTQSLNTSYQRGRRKLKKMLGDTHTPAHYPITEDELRLLLKGANLVEKFRLRPMALVTEEIIVHAEHAH